MEKSVNILDNKEAILQACFETGVQYVQATDYGVSGVDDMPVLTIGVMLRETSEDVRKTFYKSLRKHTEDPFMVMVTFSDRMINSGEIWVVKDGKWVL